VAEARKSLFLEQKEPIMTLSFAGTPSYWRWTIRCGLVAAAVLAGAKAATAQITVKKLLESDVTDIGPHLADVEQAIRRFQTNEIAEAQKLLKEAKKKNPQLPPGDVMLARLLLFANQVNAAGQVLEKVVAEEPDDPEAYILFGNMALRQGRLTSANLLLIKGYSLSSDYAANAKRKRHMQMQSLAGLTVVAQRREKWDRAEKYVTEWLKLDPENVGALTQLGQIQFQLDKEKEAYATFQKLHEIDDNTPRPEISMGLMYERADKRANAKKLMELAATRVPDHLNTRLAVAQWALEAGLIDMAKTNADAALKIDADSYQAKMLVGLVARFQGEHDKAEKLFMDAHLQAPTQFAPVNNLVLALIAQPDQEKRRLAREFAQVNMKAFNDLKTPAGRETAVTAAWVQFNLAREAEAEQLVQAVVNTRSTISAENAYFAARILNDRGRSAQALSILEPILQGKAVFPGRADAEKLLAKLKKDREKAGP